MSGSDADGVVGPARPAALLRRPAPAVRRLATRWWHRYWRGGAATLTALAGYGLLALGPAGVAAGIQEYRQWRAATAAADQPLLGVEIRDGPIAFIVHSVHCGTAAETVNGMLCEVTVAARNDGDQALTVPGSEVVLHGAEGVRHRPVAAEPEPFGAIPPGAAATALIGFDLPPTSEPTHVEVHAGPYTAGQRIALGGPPLPLLSATD
jgi:hypothetical protein